MIAAMSKTLLAKRLTPFFPSPLLCHNRQHLAGAGFTRRVDAALLNPLLGFSFSTKPYEQQESPFLANYLISSFGFSRDRALKVSANRRVAGIKTQDRPNSVVKFLKDTGLSDTQISSAIWVRPDLLACDVEKTLRPKVRALAEAGFSNAVLVELIWRNPTLLSSKNPLSCVQFWHDFVGGCGQALLKIVEKNGMLVTFDIEKSVLPRINLLNEYGLSNQDICGLLAYGGKRFINRNLDSLRQNLQFIEELGIPRKSRMFRRAFIVIGDYSKDVLVKKAEHYKVTYGWSQDDVSSAFVKAPFIFALSEDKVRAHMNFLIRKAKFDMRSIVAHPFLLTYSLEKRLVPRHRVLSILKTRGLKSWNLWSVCSLTDKKFVEKFVEPYMKDVPELADTYYADALADARNVSA